MSNHDHHAPRESMMRAATAPRPFYTPTDSTRSLTLLDVADAEIRLRKRQRAAINAVWAIAVCAGFYGILWALDSIDGVVGGVQ